MNITYMNRDGHPAMLVHYDDGRACQEVDYGKGWEQPDRRAFRRTTATIYKFFQCRRAAKLAREANLAVDWLKKEDFELASKCRTDEDGLRPLK